jgi:hypothetical protein
VLQARPGGQQGGVILTGEDRIPERTLKPIGKAAGITAPLSEKFGPLKQQDDGNRHAGGAKRLEDRDAHARIDLDIVHKGVTRSVVMTHDAWRRGRDIFQERSDCIEETEGRFGLCYRLLRLRSGKAANIVRATNRVWGFTHDRWTSARPDASILAVHMWRADRYSETAPDCNHSHHGKAGHICEAVRVITADAAIHPDLRRSRISDYEPSAETGNVSPEPESQPSPVPLAPASPPHYSTARFVGVSEHDPGLTAIQAALREIGRRPSAPILIHTLQTPYGPDTLIMSDWHGDDGLRALQTRMRNAEQVAKPNPTASINHETLADHFIRHVGALPTSCTEVIRQMGPWQPGEDIRANPDFSKWREAYYDAFRGNRLHHALKRRGWILCEVTAENRDGKPTSQLNDLGEKQWYAEPSK